jgi:peptide/nickel transport system substrate-binding protein
LEATGFGDRDGDGLRENADGSALHVAISCVELPIPKQIAQSVVDHLMAIGVSAEVMAVAQDEWGPMLMQAQFDIALHELSLSAPELAYFHFHSSRGLLNNGHVSGLNYGGYANAEFDELASEALRELDPVTLQQLTHQMQDILAADLPRIPLYSPRVLSLFRSDRFSGWTAQPGHGLLHRTSVTGLAPVKQD